MKSSSIFWEHGVMALETSFQISVYVVVHNSALCFSSNVTFFFFWFSEGTGNLVRPLIHVASGHRSFNPDSPEGLDLAIRIGFQHVNPMVEKELL
jgi:hypothetical protein